MRRFLVILEEYKPHRVLWMELVLNELGPNRDMVAVLREVNDPEEGHVKPGQRVREIHRLDESLYVDMK